MTTKTHSGTICCGKFGSNRIISNWAAQSPDGQLVLYEEDESLVVYDLEAEDEVFTVPMEDVSKRRLVYNAGWRPDSAAIYLTDLQGDEVKLLPLDGSPPRELLRGSRIAVGWSPDGRWLFATSARRGVHGNELYALDVAAGEERQVLGVPRGRGLKPSCSPWTRRRSRRKPRRVPKRSSLACPRARGGPPCESPSVCRPRRAPSSGRPRSLSTAAGRRAARAPATPAPAVLSRTRRDDRATTCVCGGTHRRALGR